MLSTGTIVDHLTPIVSVFIEVYLLDNSTPEIYLTKVHIKPTINHLKFLKTRNTVIYSISNIVYLVIKFQENTFIYYMRQFNPKNKITKILPRMGLRDIH